MTTRARWAPRIGVIPPTALFFALAYTLAWAAWIPLAVAGETVTRDDAWPSHVPGLMGQMTAMLVLSVLWAAWHAPVFIFVSGFTDYGPAMLAGFFTGMACGAVVLTWLYNRSGSVLIVAVWHGTYNIVSGSAGAEGTVQEVAAMRSGQPSVIGLASDGVRPARARAPLSGRVMEE